MIFFLQVVGGCLVALVLFVLIVFVWLRWKIKSFVNDFVDELSDTLGKMQSIPPMRLRLEQHKAVTWENSHLVDLHQTALHQQGFQKIGDFEAINPIVELEFLNMQAFMQPERKAYAVIYEAAGVGVWCDIVARYQDGRRYFITSLPDHLMDKPDYVTADFEPEYLPAALVEAYFERRPGGELLEVSADQFVNDFQDAYAAEMDWRMKRGGPTAAEIERTAERDGTEVDDETIEAIQEQWQYSFNQFIEHQLKEHFLAESGLSAAAWEKIRDRVQFVHDKQAAERVAELFVDAFEDEDYLENHYEHIVKKIKLKGPRDAFQEINSQHQIKYPFQHYGSVSEPVEADIYLFPEDNY